MSNPAFVALLALLLMLCGFAWTYGLMLQWHG